MGDLVIDLKMHLSRSVARGGQSNLFWIFIEEALSQRILVGMSSPVSQLTAVVSARVVEQ